MVNLPPFHDGCLDYSRDYTKTACANGMEVPLALPSAVLNDFDSTGDILFPSNDELDHADTMAAATWGHVDVGFSPLQDGCGSSQDACGSRGCDDEGEVESGGGGYGDLGKLTGDGYGGISTSKDTNSPSKAAFPAAATTAEGSFASYYCGEDSCEKLRELDAKRRRCCGDGCTCAVSCNCSDELLKCCDVDDELFGWSRKTAGLPDDLLSPSRAATLEPESKYVPAPIALEPKLVSPTPALTPATPATLAPEQPLQITGTVAPVDARVDPLVGNDTSRPETRIGAAGHRPCCSTHMAQAQMLYSTVPTKPSPPSSTNIPEHCGKTDAEANLAYACGLCGLSFGTQDEFEAHNAKVHNAPRPYVCNRCGATFLFKQNRDRHVVEVHEGKRPHKCPHPNCKAAFKNTSGLKQHIHTVHDKQRPFKCPHCSSSFGQRNHLSQHILVVHKRRKLFNCDKCGSSFSNRGNLNQHKKRKHKKKEDAETVGGGDRNVGSKKSKSKGGMKTKTSRPIKPKLALEEKTKSCADEVQASDMTPTNVNVNQQVID